MLVDYSDSDQEIKPEKVPNPMENVKPKKQRLPDAFSLLSSIPNSYLSKYQDIKPEQQEEYDPYETYHAVPPPDFSIQKEGDMLKQFGKGIQKRKLFVEDTVDGQKKMKQGQSNINLGKKSYINDNNNNQTEKIEQKKDFKQDKKQSNPFNKFVPRQVQSKKPNITTE